MFFKKIVPKELKESGTALGIGIVCEAFLKAKWMSKMLIKTPLATGGREMFDETALFPEKGFVVVDVGAYKGWYTFLVSKMVGACGHVYSFEPEPSNLRILTKNVHLNRLRNVTVFGVALSNENGFKSLSISENPSMHSITLKRGCRTVNVPTYKLDTLVSTGKMLKPDLVKIDVEGAELTVLKGTLNIMRKFNPIFSIDVNHYECEAKEVEEFMKRNHYEVRVLSMNVDGPTSLVCTPSASLLEAANCRKRVCSG